MNLFQSEIVEFRAKIVINEEEYCNILTNFEQFAAEIQQLQLNTDL
jgi:hypothetical protein